MPSNKGGEPACPNGRTVPPHIITDYLEYFQYFYKNNAIFYKSVYLHILFRRIDAFYVKNMGKNRKSHLKIRRFSV